MEKLIVVVGDIHGCLEEFNELVKTLQYNKDKMRLVLLGDLMDRGPDPVGCIRLARELKAECVMGNHEEKHLRWIKHEKNKLRTGKANPMKRMSDADIKANSNLSDQDISWIKNLPLKLHLKDNWWAVHAGCEPKFTLDKQNPAQIMRVRYVNENGTGVPLGDTLEQPPNSVYWTEQWNGPESIVYGHCVHSFSNPRHDIKNNIHCLGIDTGCCFGGSLTAAIFKDDNQFDYIQIKAKREYYKLSVKE